MPARRPLLVLVALVLCDPAAAIEPGDHVDRTLVHRGIERTYDLLVPPGYDEETPIPLVFDLHGNGSTKEQQRVISGIRRRANENGFAVVWPNGTDNSWNAGLCCGLAVDNEIDDVGFLRTLADAVAREVSIDRTRMYVTGLSNGGAMSQRIACEASDFFAAAAPLAFPIPLAPTTSCTPARPMPVLAFQGTTDVLVPYEGIGAFPSAWESFAHWRLESGCGADEIEVHEESGASSCDVDTSCAAGVEVGLCSILSTDEIIGGHILYLNDDWELSQLVWDFLSRFTLPDDALPRLPHGVAGKKLVLKDEADPAKGRLSLALKDPALELGAATDPTQDGAELVLFGSGASADVACFALPAANWKRKGGGFVYKDKAGSAGPCTSAKIGAEKVEVSCSAKHTPLGYSLDEAAQGAVSVRFSMGQRSFCATFGGTVQKDTSTAAGKGQFAAKSAAAPAACPAAPPRPCP